MKERNTEGLREHERKRRSELEQIALEAIDHLLELNEKVNFSSVAKKTSISRTFLYRNRKISQKISELRESPRIRYQKGNGTSNEGTNNVAIKLQQVLEQNKRLLVENNALRAEINSIKKHIEAIFN